MNDYCTNTSIDTNYTYTNSSTTRPITHARTQANPATVPAMTTPPPATMPMRGDEDAPHFDPEKPRTLRQFFEDLEFCFDITGIKDSKKKKIHARRYVEDDVQDLWMSLKSYSEASQTYEDFKKAIYRFYPDAEVTKTWTLAALMHVVNE